MVRLARELDAKVILTIVVVFRDLEGSESSMTGCRLIGMPTAERLEARLELYYG